MDALLDRGWHRLFLAHVPHLLALPPRGLSSFLHPLPLPFLFYFVPFPTVALSELGGPRCPSLLRLCSLLAQMRLNPLEQWAFDWVLLFRSCPIDAKFLEGEENDKSAEELEVRGMVGMVESCLGQHQSPPGGQQRLRLARMVVLADRLSAVEADTVCRHFFPDHPIEHIRALWR